MLTLNSGRRPVGGVDESSFLDLDSARDRRRGRGECAAGPCRELDDEGDSTSPSPKGLLESAEAGKQASDEIPAKSTRAGSGAMHSLIEEVAEVSSSGQASFSGRSVVTIHDGLLKPRGDHEAYRT